MMTRAWLILADILVTLLLFGSFILFYVNPSVKKTNLSSDDNITEINLPFSSLDVNDTISLDDLIRMAQEENAYMYKEEKVENRFLTRTLKDALFTLSAKIGDPVFIRIFKEESLLEVWIRPKTEYVHLKDYAICAYSGRLGPKEKEGDFQAPEGFYSVTKKRLNPHSKFHLSFNLGYPNAYDRAHKRTGSFLMVHGKCASAGCYAMTDAKIDEIYALVKKALYKGQKEVSVHAYPFKMTEENMALYEGNKWYDFWVNLKEGYDYFESEKKPPKIKVINKRYEIFED